MSASPVRVALLELLMMIDEHRSFPVQIDGDTNIGLLKTLVTAGLVSAQIPPPFASAGKLMQPGATVSAITSTGSEWMRNELRFQKARRRSAAFQARSKP